MRYIFSRQVQSSAYIIWATVWKRHSSLCMCSELSQDSSHVQQDLLLFWNFLLTGLHVFTWGSWMMHLHDFCHIKGCYFFEIPHLPSFNNTLLSERMTRTFNYIIWALQRLSQFLFGMHAKSESRLKPFCNASLRSHLLCKNFDSLIDNWFFCCRALVLISGLWLADQSTESLEENLRLALTYIRQVYLVPSS